MKFRSKIVLGSLFFFIQIVIISVYSIYSSYTIAQMGKSLFTNNSRSVEYGDVILSSIEQSVVMYGRNRLTGDDDKKQLSDLLGIIEKNITDEEHNITETGERELIQSVRAGFSEFKKKMMSEDEAKSGIRNISEILVQAQKINSNVHQISRLNLKAIERKSVEINDYENRFYMYISIIATLCFLISFSFIFNFPDIAGTAKKQRNWADEEEKK